MSVTALSDCNCHENAEHVYSIDSEHPCVYDQVVATVNGTTVTRDYYYKNVLMFTVTTEYIALSPVYFVEGDKTIS